MSLLSAPLPIFLRQNFFFFLLFPPEPSSPRLSRLILLKLSVSGEEKAAVPPQNLVLVFSPSIPLTEVFHNGSIISLFLLS